LCLSNGAGCVALGLIIAAMQHWLLIRQVCYIQYCAVALGLLPHGACSMMLSLWALIKDHIRQRIVSFSDNQLLQACAGGGGVHTCASQQQIKIPASCHWGLGVRSFLRILSYL
jgi:hypothetical protein